MCFKCQNGLREFEYDDDPWVEHAIHFPHCEYLIQKRGTVFIDIEMIRRKGLTMAKHGNFLEYHSD